MSQPASTPAEPLFIDGQAHLQLLNQRQRLMMAGLLIVLGMFLPWTFDLLLLGYLGFAACLLFIVYFASWPGVVLLVTSAAAIYLLRWEFDRPLRPIQDGSFMLLLVSILSIGFRYCERVRYARAYAADNDDDEMGQTSSVSFVSTLLTPTSWAGAVAVVASIWLITIFPETREMRREFGIQMAAGRMIFFLFALFAGWMICRAIWRIVRRFRITPEAADIASRSMFSDEVWSSMAGVEKRRAKLFNVRDH